MFNIKNKTVNQAKGICQLTAILEGSEWRIINQNGVGSEPQLFIYVVDQGSQTVLACSVSLADFAEIGRKALSHPAPEGFKDALIEILQVVYSGDVPEKTENLDWDHQLAMMLSAYVGTTSFANLVHRASTNSHITVLNYRKSLDAIGVLRPYLLPFQDEYLVSAVSFVEYLGSILELDQANHPEWFN